MSIIGNIAYKYYYGPRNERRKIEKYGGAEEYSSMLKNELKMREYAFSNLDFSFDFLESGGISLNFLSGEKFLHQTLFCIYSFFQNVSSEDAKLFSVNIYDDGSFNSELVAILKKKLPKVRMIPLNQSKENISSLLPIEKYPYSHQMVKDLFFFNKLFFLHTDKTSTLKLYLDSDMLFHKKPVELLDWLKRSDLKENSVFGIHDVKQSYGYNDSVLKTVSLSTYATAINAGFYGMNTNIIDFDFIESYIKIMMNKYGKHYYMEQFLTAILLNQDKLNLTMLPKQNYIVMPSKIDVDKSNGVLHHYVDTSKKDYFNVAWKKLSI